MGSFRVPTCEVCFKSILDSPNGFVAYKDSPMCEDCLNRLYSPYIPEIALVTSGISPIQRPPREVTEASRMLKQFLEQNLAPKESQKCAKVINSWFAAASRLNLARPQTFADISAKGNLPKIGELLLESNSKQWVCVNCGKHALRQVKKCSCGYHELSLYGWTSAAKVYWACDRCHFEKNIVTRAECVKCGLVNSCLVRERKPPKCRPF